METNSSDLHLYECALFTKFMKRPVISEGVIIELIVLVSSKYNFSIVSFVKSIINLGNIFLKTLDFIAFPTIIVGLRIRYELLFLELNLFKIYSSASLFVFSYKLFGFKSGPRLDYATYLTRVVNTEFLISTGGDREDCYRHYEAIGLGTKPVSNINRKLYSQIFESISSKPPKFPRFLKILVAREARKKKCGPFLAVFKGASPSRHSKLKKKSIFFSVLSISELRRS